MKTLAIALVLLMQAPLAQQAPPPQQIVVVVRDESGRLIKHLRASDFTIEESGAHPAILNCVETSDLPISLGVMVDTSGSMVTSLNAGLNGLRGAIGAARLLVRAMKPGDEFVLMSFSGGFSVRQDFTEDMAGIEEGLRSIRGGGDSNLIPGVSKALTEVKKSQHRRRALVVISDVFADGDLERLAGSVQVAEVAVYTLAVRSGAGNPPGVVPVDSPKRNDAGIRSVDREHPSQAIMDALETESGGRSAWMDIQSADLIAGIRQFAEDMSAEVRGQYTLSYYPAKPESSGNPIIRVRTTVPGSLVQLIRR